MFLSQLRFHLKEKYRARYSELHRKFVSEREEILRMIRDECQDIISEAQLLLIRKRAGGAADSGGDVWTAKRDDNFDDHEEPYAPPGSGTGSGGFKVSAQDYLRRNNSSGVATPINGPLNRSIDSSSSRLSHRSSMYAEMLSPDETQELVRSVLEKVSVNSWHEFQSAYQSVDVSSSGASFDLGRDGRDMHATPASAPAARTYMHDRAGKS
jgi:hypothetical protein